VLRVEYLQGLCLPELDLWLDAAEPRAACVITHAHSDHIAPHRRVIATPETARLFRHRLGEAETEELPYGERRDYGRYALTLYPAGHCLGSAQVLVEADGERLLYTGDFKLRENVVAASARIIACDTLVMEATFGEPRYRFPPQEEVVARLYQAVDQALAQGRVPVVLAYALGKGQEALELLLRRGYRVMLHGAVWNIAQIYRELGVRFSGQFFRYERGALDGHVLIAPPSCRRMPMIANIPHRYVIMLTGWALHRSAPYIYRGVDLLLPLSDHADFDELLRVATESGARRILTTHGEASFARHLRALGFDARHLAVHPPRAERQRGQRTLPLDW